MAYDSLGRWVSKWKDEFDKNKGAADVFETPESIIDTNPVTLGNMGPQVNPRNKNPEIAKYMRKLNTPYYKFWKKIEQIQSALYSCSLVYKEDINKAFPEAGESLYPYSLKTGPEVYNDPLDLGGQEEDEYWKRYILVKTGIDGKPVTLKTNTGQARTAQNIRFTAQPIPVNFMPNEKGFTDNPEVYGANAHASKYMGKKEFFKRLIKQWDGKNKDTPILSHTAASVTDPLTGEEYMSKILNNDFTDFNNTNYIKVDVMQSIDNFKNNMKALTTYSDKTFNTRKIRTLTRTKMSDFGWKQSIDRETNAEWQLQAMWNQFNYERNDPRLPKAWPKLMYARIWGNIDDRAYLRAVGRTDFSGLPTNIAGYESESDWRHYCDCDWIEVEDDEGDMFSQTNTGTKFIATKPWWIP